MMSVVAIPELVTIDIAGRSDQGTVREENQAVVRHARTQFGDLLVLASGVGDDVARSHASRKAADTISSRIEGMPAFFPSEIAVEEAVRQANTELTAMAAMPDCPYESVGVTVVVALLRTDVDQARAIIGSVGDSRAYVVRDRKLTLLTQGHSATPDVLDGKWTTPQEAETYPDASMPTRCLGKGLDVRVEMREIPLRAGDTLLLCSDGLWSHVSEKEIERVLADGDRSVEEASSALLNLALDAGGHENVAVEIARLTQSSRSPAAAARSVELESEELAKRVVTQETPVIEWQAPESIMYGAPLNDAQLNATSSVPGTFQYLPGPGAVLATGEHTLSVVFTPSNQSRYASAQATAPLTVAQATPWISWPTADSINSRTPLGSAQLNASATVPGTFAYRPSTGETLGAGVHTLSVTFTPADCVNYADAQASVTLTVIESMPAEVTWQSPASIAYGTALGDEQFNARSSVPGSFLYAPAPGNVLPPGEHELSVIFTPEDQVKYSKARTSVTLIVEALPIVAPLPSADLATALAAEAPLSETETGEMREAEIAARQAEMPLFRSFQSSIDRERGQKRAGKWSIIFSVAIAIPMLFVLIFLVVKVHSGAPIIANEVQQPAAAATDTQPQPDVQDPSHRVKITVSQQPAGNEAQPGSKSQPGNNEQAVKPAELQTETTHDQSAAQTTVPQGGERQAAANTPSSASPGAPEAGGTGGSKDGAVNRDAEPIDRDRDGASSAVAVSAAAEAGRLMESRTPIYPPIAKASGISGTVVLDATISKDGTVKDLSVVSGPAQLREAALQSVRTWRYRPFMLNNEPSAVETSINVVFSLDN